MDYKKLATAVKLCGNIKGVEGCKKCPYWKGPDMTKCIPRMTVDAASAITDLLARAEAAETAQVTLQRAVAEYKARAEKAESERDAAVNDLKKEVMGKIYACDYCKKNDPDDFQCTHDDLCGCHEWEWRGQKEE